MLNNEQPLFLLVTDYRGLIPQRIMACHGYDLDRIQKVIENAGVQL